MNLQDASPYKPRSPLLHISHRIQRSTRHQVSSLLLALPHLLCYSLSVVRAPNFCLLGILLLSALLQDATLHDQHRLELLDHLCLR
ncbi:hypothetical protein F383_06756 [Gossypium arboreum]|uniref:Uncharacterized protein n=1 Tax=Gossypium arboreum TaxID=29729 RepID=A0A0B0PPN8_GOSAR|nr:hypothetical protein F383_06756 [Gossypium arboreum]